VKCCGGRQGAGDQRLESDQQRIGHIGQQNFAGRGSAPGGRETARHSGGGDAVNRKDQQHHGPSISDRGRQPRESCPVFY